MNNQNPLIPQGSALEQKSKGRARVKIAVFFVLAVHGIGLMALLMQGCGQSKEAVAPPENPVSDPPPAFFDTNNPPITTSNVAVVVTTPTPPEAPVTPIVPAGATEYSIVKGDNFSTLAKKFHVPVSAITDANPGVDSTKLKIGQKIHIPAPVAPTAPTMTGIAPVETPAAGGEQTYKVKSGDNLTKVAGQFGVKVSALRAANNLKTDRLSVGQKLKIPAKASAVPAAPPALLEFAPPTPPASTPSVEPSR